MALVVEDGSGKADAESYLSEADADAYNTAHSASTDWSGASTVEKEVALRRATQYLDMEYGARWKGMRSNEDQALDWPRYDADDRDEVVLDSNEMPQRLLDATAECAERFITEDMLPDQTDPGVVTSTSVRVGPLSEAKTYSGGKEPGKGYPVVEALLRGLLAVQGMVVRG